VRIEPGFHRMAAMHIRLVPLILVLGALYFLIARAWAKEPPRPRDTLLGTSLSPAHLPFPARADFTTFFDEAAAIGSHVTWICEWESMPTPAQIRIIQNLVRRSGLKFHFYLSPIALIGGRKAPAIPAAVGGSSFADASVRRAYKDQVLALAALSPDYLGLATEVNFLAQNPPELAAFASLARETYDEVKQKYPAQVVTISFQWDVMRANPQFNVVQQFAHSLDVYSFTSYPDAFGSPTKIPADYFSSVRKILPSEPLGFSEIGWSSAPPSSEDDQARFYAQLPEFMRGVHPAYVTLALLHDVDIFKDELARLNAVGIRRIDDAPKKSWNVVLGFPDLH
jgi:hypothetical protein